MKTDSIVDKLIIEEIKATKLFLWLFYIIFFAYDLFYYFILPLYISDREIGFSTEGIGYWLHIIVLTFVPVSIYLLKSGKPNIIKYFYFIGYNIIDLFNSLLIYLGTDLKFASGNIVELYFVLGTSIFINKKYFWIIIIGSILKYALLGIVLHDGNVLIGIVILSILAGISYLFLSRFYSYIHTLEKINEELRQNEKMVLVGQLATSIGHEIRNPLAALKGFTQLQQEKHPDDQEYYQIMNSEIERINLIVDDLMYIGKPKSMVIKKHYIKETLQFVVNMLSQVALANKVIIKMDIDESVTINCDGNQLKQVFINILKNAFESMPNGGTIQISSKMNEDKQFVIIIEDEGQGIEADKVEMLGKPFYTTKQDGNGLGLMVTFNIIEQHKGKLVYRSTPGKGTTVEIYLPSN
jgi:signal transduction histidine kinase